MMVRSISSNTRPDTLMQDRTLQAYRFLLQRTAGPYIGVKSRHSATSAQRPLYPDKRTSTDATSMSAWCQNLTRRSKCIAISTALAGADRNRGIVACAENSARTSPGAGRRQCAGTAVTPAFCLSDARSARIQSDL
jgi:hypothetical protein